MLGFLKRGLQYLGRGASGFLRGDLTSALVTTDGHARFQEAVLQGNVWIGANAQATAVTPQAGLSATTPVLTLFNPLNSPVNLVLWHVTAGVSTIHAAQVVYSLAYNGPNLAGVPTGPATVTNANITNALLSLGITGSATAVQTQGQFGQCYRISTLNAAPVAFRFPFTAMFGTSVGVQLAYGVDRIDGEIVVPPGVAVSIQATAAQGGLIASMCWEEVLII